MIAPNADIPTDPFVAELREVRGRPEPVVVDRRADRPEVLCRSLGEASALAAEMNRQAISSGRANRTVPERRGDGGRDETISSETRDTRLDRV